MEAESRLLLLCWHLIAGEFRRRRCSFAGELSNGRMGKEMREDIRMQKKIKHIVLLSHVHRDVGGPFKDAHTRPEASSHTHTHAHTQRHTHTRTGTYLAALSYR